MIEDIEIAPPSVVRQAADDFAAALAETPQVLAAGTVLHSIGEITTAVAAALVQPETGGPK